MSVCAYVLCVGSGIPESARLQSIVQLAQVIARVRFRVRVRVRVFNNYYH